MVLPVFNPPFSQPNRQKKKRKRRGHQSDKKEDRVATERRKQQREWDFMVWLMVRKLCGLLLSVLKV